MGLCFQALALGGSQGDGHHVVFGMEDILARISPTGAPHNPITVCREPQSCQWSPHCSPPRFAGAAV
jgi:hypothetical protein